MVNIRKTTKTLIYIAFIILLSLNNVYAYYGLENDTNLVNTPYEILEIKNDKSTSTDIPTWVIGDSWTYEADIFSDTENGLFDISSDALTLSVENITSIIHENRSVDVYIIKISGDVYGTLDSSLFSGDVDGIIDGDVVIRQADLSILSSNISTYGILEWLLFDFDYNITSIATYHPCFEYFDFPINVNESWNTTSTIHQNSSFYVETFYDNQTESTESMNGNATCDAISNISVPAGSFSCFHLISQGNGTIESWYNTTVKNMVKLFIDQSNETETSKIFLNLTSYMLHNESINVTVDIDPFIVDVDEDVTISGMIRSYDTNQPLPNANVTITIPYTNDQYDLKSDPDGNYSLTIKAPLLVDSTNTSYDIGSDGIIISSIYNALHGFSIATMTVTGIAITDVESHPEINYETNPVNITCTIYSVDPIEKKIINITGPAGFTSLNVTLQESKNDCYYDHRSYTLTGAYSYYIWAKDVNGKTNKSNIFNFTVVPDTIPPSIQNITAIPNPQYANNSVNISCYVTDNVDVESVHIILTDPYDQINNISMNQGIIKYYYDQQYVILGNYSYYIWTIDTLGNTNNSSASTFMIIPDVTPPQISDQSPEIAFKNQTFTFQANITDNARVIDAYIEYWYGTGVHTNESMTFMGEDEWTYTILVPNTDDILYYVISANDSSNNWNNTGITNVSVVNYEEIDINQSVFDRGFPIRHAMDGDWAGAQSFIPTMNMITKVEIYLRVFGTPEFNLTVELRENDPQGILLELVTFTPSMVPSSWTWFEIDFEDQIVALGTDYFIVIPPAPSGVTTSFGYEWGYAFGDQYSGGSFWFTRDGGGIWRDLPSMYEFTFKTYGHL